MMWGDGVAGLTVSTQLHGEGDACGGWFDRCHYASRNTAELGRVNGVGEDEMKIGSRSRFLDAGMCMESRRPAADQKTSMIRSCLTVFDFKTRICATVLRRALSRVLCCCDSNQIYCGTAAESI